MTTDKLAYWTLPRKIDWWDYNDGCKDEDAAKPDTKQKSKKAPAIVTKQVSWSAVVSRSSRSLYVSFSHIVFLSHSNDANDVLFQANPSITQPIKEITTPIKEITPPIKEIKQIKQINQIKQIQSPVALAPEEPKKSVIDIVPLIEIVPTEVSTLVSSDPVPLTTETESGISPMDIDSPPIEPTEPIQSTKTKKKKKKNKNKNKNKKTDPKERLLAQLALAEECLYLSEKEFERLESVKNEILQENQRLKMQTETLEAKELLITTTESKIKELQTKLQKDKAQLQKDQDVLKKEQLQYDEIKEKFIQDCEKMKKEVPIVERRQQYLEMKKQIYGDSSEKKLKFESQKLQKLQKLQNPNFTAYRFNITFHQLNYAAMQRIIELSREGLLLLQSILMDLGETELVVEIKLLNRMVRYLMKHKTQPFFYVMWPNKGRKSKPGLEHSLAILYQKTTQALKFAETKLHVGLADQLQGKKPFQKDMKTFLLQNACQSALDVHKIAASMLTPNQTAGVGAYLKSVREPDLCPECALPCYERKTVCKLCAIDVCSDICVKVHLSMHDKKQCMINASIDKTIEQSLKGGENCMNCGICYVQWLRCRYIVFSLVIRGAQWNKLEGDNCSIPLVVLSYLGLGKEICDQIVGYEEVMNSYGPEDDQLSMTSELDGELLTQKMSVCGLCKIVSYCSKECQKADHRKHMEECRFIKGSS